MEQGYELLHSLHTPDGVPMDEEAKHVHFHDFSDVSKHFTVVMEIECFCRELTYTSDFH